MEVETLLRDLDISGTLIGFWYLKLAIELEIKNPGYSAWITKGMYIDISKHFSTTASRVERSMRSAISAAWKSPRGKEHLEAMGFEHKPSNSEFIDAASFQIRKSGHPIR